MILPITTNDGNKESQSGYSKTYFVNNENDYQLSSKHGIRIYKDGKEMSNCLLLGSEGTTGIHQTSSLLSNDQLIICCSNTISSLTLPVLELNWTLEADEITCFQVICLEEDYIVHGVSNK